MMGITTLITHENTPTTELVASDQGQNTTHIVEWDIRTDPDHSEEGAVDGCSCGCSCGCGLREV